MRYGIPYMGSKSRIAKYVCNIFPSASNFYDLFGGGFAISHCMIKHRQKDFKNFIYNDLRPGLPQLIQDAIAGKYNYKNFRPEFITRDVFNAKKNEDIYIKLIWSFGNDGRSYLFGKDIEKQKESLHNAIVFNLFDEFAKEFFRCECFKHDISITDRRFYSRSMCLGRCDIQQLEQLQHLQQLQQLERLQKLERIQKLQQLERISFLNIDYKSVKIEDESVIYCDIPYRGTAEYDRNIGFNHNEFFDWASEQKCPVFISEYNIDDERFSLVFKKEIKSMMSSKCKVKSLEKVYANKIGFNAFLKRRVTSVNA